MNIQDAEIYFKKYNGQSFHMQREDPARFEAYKILNIAQTTKEKWVKELFLEYKNEITNMRDLNSSFVKPSDNFQKMSWLKFGRIIDLTQSYPAMREALYSLVSKERAKILPSERVIVAESLIGRGHLKFRSALPFYCYEDNQKILAQNFLSLAETLILEGKKAGHAIDRHDEALKRITKIRHRVKFPLFYSLIRK